MALDSAGERRAAYCIIACAEAASNLSRYDGLEVRIPDAGERAAPGTAGQDPHTGVWAGGRQRILLGNFVPSAGIREDYYRRRSRAREGQSRF